MRMAFSRQLSRRQVVVRANWGAPVDFSKAKVVSNKQLFSGMHQLVVDVGTDVAASYTKPGQYIQVRTTPVICMQHDCLPLHIFAGRCQHDTTRGRMAGGQWHSEMCMDGCAWTLHGTCDHGVTHYASACLQAKVTADNKAGFFAIASGPNHPSLAPGSLELLIKTQPGATAEAIVAVGAGGDLLVSPVQGKGFAIDRIPAEDVDIVLCVSAERGWEAWGC